MLKITSEEFLKDIQHIEGSLGSWIEGSDDALPQLCE